MTATLYSHALRILCCQRCGAPIEAAVQGGAFPCGYCGAVNQLAPRDERGDLERANAAPAMSESERYSRLREQDRVDEGLPPSIAALVTLDGALEPVHLEPAKRDWLASRAQIEAAPSFPVQERFFHLTVLLAPHFDERARRATLETAAELLTDARHRHVLRCLLATYAAREGDTAAAEEWLSACNPRPLDLVMDSSYRLAAATVARARGDHAGTLAVLGTLQDDVPIASGERLACALLRIDALERVGREDEATQALRACIGAHGEASVRTAIHAQRPLRICGETLFRIIRARHREEVAALEAQNAAAQQPWFQLGALFGAAAVLAMTLTLAGGMVWGWGADLLDLDPLFGAHADLLCPSVCEGCRGPYRYASWRVTERDANGSSTAIYSHRLCQDGDGRIAEMAQPDITFAVRRGDAWILSHTVRFYYYYPSMILVFIPIGLGVLLSHSSSDISCTEKAERTPPRGSPALAPPSPSSKPAVPPSERGPAPCSRPRRELRTTHGAPQRPPPRLRRPHPRGRAA